MQKHVPLFPQEQLPKGLDPVNHLAFSHEL